MGMLKFLGAAALVVATATALPNLVRQRRSACGPPPHSFVVGLDASKSVGGDPGWLAEITFSKKLANALIDAGHKVHLYVACPQGAGLGARYARTRMCVALGDTAITASLGPFLARPAWPAVPESFLDG